MRNRAEGIGRIESIRQLNRKKSYYRIKNLETLNSPYSEYSPAYLNGELYFTSSRSNAKIYAADRNTLYDLYKVTTKAAIVEQKLFQPLPVTINSPNVNVGTIAFLSRR